MSINFNAGLQGLSDYEGVTSPAYDISLEKFFRFNERLYYLLRSDALFQMNLRSISRGIWNVHDQVRLTIKINFESNFSNTPAYRRKGTNSNRQLPRPQNGTD